MFLIAEVADPDRSALVIAVVRADPRARCSSRSASSRSSTRTSSGASRCCLVIYLFGFGVPGTADRRALRPVDVRSTGSSALVLVVLGVRRGGLPGGDRVGASEPDGGGAIAGPVALAVAAVRRAAAGGAPGRSRRCSTTSSACRRTPRSWRCSGSIEALARGADLQLAATSTTRASSWPRFLFILVTIPLARFTDHLIARDGAAAARRGRRAMTRARAPDRGRAQVLRRPRRSSTGSTSTVAPHEVVCLIGASGLGQVHAAAVHQPARAGRRGPDLAGRRGDHRTGRRR